MNPVAEELAGDEYFQFRLDKVKTLQKAGIAAYPDRFPDVRSCGEAAGLSDGTEGVRCAGRIISMRKMGKLMFLHLQDITGKIQIALRKGGISDEEFDQAKDVLDIGDFIGVEGRIFVTRTGELTIDVTRLYFFE